MNVLPPVFWRISNHRDLTGRGGLHGDGRWHRRGRRVIYLAESPPGALLEILVHLELPGDVPPRQYQLLQIGWASSPTPPAWDDLSEGELPNVRRTQKIGDKWLAEGNASLARVRSAIMPRTFNWLLNPMHPAAASMEIVEATFSPYDPRLLRQIGTLA